MAAKQGPHFLFCKPTMTGCILSVSFIFCWNATALRGSCKQGLGLWG
jgi:hypothetical protein